jgi:hypothetical protein
MAILRVCEIGPSFSCLGKSCLKTCDFVFCCVYGLDGLLFVVFIFVCSFCLLGDTTSLKCAPYYNTIVNVVLLGGSLFWPTGQNYGSIMVVYPRNQ